MSAQTSIGSSPCKRHCASSYKKDTETQRRQQKSAFTRIIRVCCVLILLAWLQGSVFTYDVVARTNLAGIQVPMPHDKCLGISHM